MSCELWIGLVLRERQGTSVGDQNHLKGSERAGWKPAPTTDTLNHSEHLRRCDVIQNSQLIIQNYFVSIRGTPAASSMASISGTWVVRTASKSLPISSSSARSSSKRSFAL